MAGWLDIFRGTPGLPGQGEVIRNAGLWDQERATLDALHRSYLDARAAVSEEQRQEWGDILDLLNYQFKESFERYYSGIHQVRSKRFRESGGKQYRYLPLLRMMAHRLAVNLATPPEIYLYQDVDGERRRLPASDPQARQLRSDIEAANLEMVLPQIDIWRVALRQVVVSPSWVRGRIDWRVYSPADVYVDQDPLDPSRIEYARQVTIALPQRVDSVLGQTEILNRRFLSWRYDEEYAEPWTHWIHDESGRLIQDANRRPVLPLFPSAVNEYGFHPVVLWREEVPLPGRIWHQPRQDWLQAQHGVNDILTDAAYGISKQTHAQPVMNGMPTSKAEHVVGPEDAMHFPDATGNFRYVPPPVDLAELRDTLNIWLRLLAVAEDLPPDTWEASSSTRNFAAKKLEAFQLLIRQMRSRPTSERSLVDTVQMMMRIGNHWAGKGARRVVYADDVRVGVRLQDLPWPEDRFQAAQSAAAEDARGTGDAVTDIMRTENVSREEAERLRDERRARAGASSAAPPTGGVPRPPDAQDR